jgi:beta-galactosidase
VSDIFRIPKPAAYLYASQCDPAEQVVLEAGFFLSQGDRSAAGWVHRVPILSNCDHLKIYWVGELKQELDPDRKTYAHLKHPPFLMDLGELPLSPFGDLKIEGYIGGKLAKTLVLSSSGIDAAFKMVADDTELAGDGRDATRVVLTVTDEYGNIRPFSTVAVSLSLTGPGELIGENPLVLVSGAAAVWVKATEGTGVVNLTAKHPSLGSHSVAIRVKPTEPELI